MTELNFKNHKIKLSRIGDVFTISPFYFKDKDKKQHSSMGDIILVEKSEIALLIHELNNLLHGQY